MEKYYLGQVNTSQSSPAPKNSVKFVEIQFSRRPPTLGIVRITNSQADRSGKNVKNCYDVDLISLELIGDKQAEFKICKSVKLDQLNGRIVSYDVTSQVQLESSQPKLQCIILCSDGSLFAIQFNDERVVRLECESSSVFKLNSDQLIDCQIYLDAENTDDNNDHRTVAILSAKSIQIFSETSEANRLKLAHRYQLKNPTDSKFKRMVLINKRLVLLESLDSTIQIIQQSKCLHRFKLRDQASDSQRDCEFLIIKIATLGDQPTAMIITMNSTEITAYSLQVDEDSMGKQRVPLEDPDQLLMKEPSFEFDECWSIDLQDLDSIRSLEASGQLKTISGGCMCPIWSLNQTIGSDWPKYLVISFKYLMLIYSFEQKQSLLFSVVYDSSFLEIMPMSSTGEPASLNTFARLRSTTGSDKSDYCDIKMRPKLVLNSKLIGSQRGDLLFNTLFLGKKIQLNQMVNFPQLGFLMTSSNQNHLLAFKIPSPKLNIQKDNVYQQLIAESIKSNSLLSSNLSQIENQNSNLRRDISKLTVNAKIGDSTSSANQSSDSSFKNLDSILHVELKRRHNIGVLYDLIFSMSNLIKISEIVVTSTVKTYFLPPIGDESQDTIEEVHLDNNLMATGESKAFVLSNITPMDGQINLENLLRKQEHDEEPVQNWISLRLTSDWETGNEQQNINDGINLTVPVFIVDGQVGQLSIYFIFKTPNFNEERNLVADFNLHSFNTHEDLTDDLMSRFPIRFYRRSIKIKPLMSYETDETLIQDISLNNIPNCELVIEGQFKDRQLVNWLDECLLLPGDKFSQSTSMRFQSQFTHCSISLNLKESHLRVTSDDSAVVELIKRHLLKRATDELVKLEITKQPDHTPFTLRHMISCQHRNVLVLENMITSRPTTDGMGTGISMFNYDNPLIDLLIGEENLTGLPEEYIPLDASSMEESFRIDIEKMLKSSKATTLTSKDSLVESDTKDNKTATEQLGDIYKEIIVAHLLDCLVDQEKFQFQKQTSQRKMIEAREKISNILEKAIGLEASFVDQILSLWSKLNQ